MQWLELPSGKRICEITGADIRVQRTEIQYIVITLSNGRAIEVDCKNYIDLVESEGASRVLLAAELGADIVKAIFKLSGQEKIYASQVAQQAYDIAFERHTRATKQRALEILDEVPGA